MNYEYDDSQRALEGRDENARYFGADGPELHTWQVAITFGPCSEVEAAEVLRDLTDRARFGPSFGLERL